MQLNPKKLIFSRKAQKDHETPDLGAKSMFGTSGQIIFKVPKR